MLRISSMTMSLPRHAAFEVSACHGGAVEVFMPLPIPAMIRPTIICGTEYDVICKMAPTLMMVVPARTHFLRPKISPMKYIKRAPKKHPNVIGLVSQLTLP